VSENLVNDSQDQRLIPPGQCGGDQCRGNLPVEHMLLTEDDIAQCTQCGTGVPWLVE
jgi:hypothetical protein